MKIKIRLALALAAFSPAASAQILVPTSQGRFVEAKASINAGAFTIDLRSAAGFGPFSDAASVSRTGPGPFLASSADASQASTISTDSIVATGAAEADTSSALTDSSGRSQCVVTFSVSQPVSYRAFGTLTSSGTGVAFFRLARIGSAFALSQDAYAGLAYPFDLSGVLPPGTYQFIADAHAAGQDGGPVGAGEATFDVRFELAAVTATDCTPSLNSAGNAALIHTTQRAWPNQFTLEVTGGVPGEFGLMVYGQPRPAMPTGDGLLCVGQPLIRFPSVRSFDFSGSAFDLLSISSSPFDSGPGAIAYGSRWSFQFWYRDSAAQQSGFNLSNALTVTFIP